MVSFVLYGASRGLGWGGVEVVPDTVVLNDTKSEK